MEDWKSPITAAAATAVSRLTASQEKRERVVIVILAEQGGVRRCDEK